VWPLPPSTMTVLVVRGSHNLEEVRTHSCPLKPSMAIMAVASSA
jgi:hypothetical protein